MRTVIYLLALLFVILGVIGLLGGPFWIFTALKKEGITLIFVVLLVCGLIMFAAGLFGNDISRSSPFRFERRRIAVVYLILLFSLLGFWASVIMVWLPALIHRLATPMRGPWWLPFLFLLVMFFGLFLGPRLLKQE